MYKIAVLGDRESILGYRTLGFEVCSVETAEEGERELSRLAAENTAIIYITEQLASSLEEEIARYKDAEVPAIIMVPGKGGSLGIGLSGVHASVERAVGADILNNKQ